MMTIDFETYSEAGYRWDYLTGHVGGLGSGSSRGISVVGAAAYAAHKTTELLCLAYGDEGPPTLWVPGMPRPNDLLDYVAMGGDVEAHNVQFELLIWEHVCVKMLGWPALKIDQVFCSAAKCRAFGLPGALERAAVVLGTTPKGPDGKRLIQKLCVPKSPLKSDPQNYRRMTPASEPEEFKKLYEYCVQDINCEREISHETPDLSAFELAVMRLDLEINTRGVCLDVGSARNAVSLMNQAFAKYQAEFVECTGGKVESAEALDQFKTWLDAQGHSMPSLTKDTIAAALEDLELPDVCRRPLEIREILGSANAKKLFSMLRYVSPDDHMRGLFVYCGAQRTRRWAGSGPQPQNLASKGPATVKCTQCATVYGNAMTRGCPACNAPRFKSVAQKEWGIDGINHLHDVMKARDLDVLEAEYGDPLTAICGSLRSMFTASPGYELVCSDFSAIEAVIMSEVSGCQWRIDVFNGDGMIYEATGARIAGITLDEVLGYKKEHGVHHPCRRFGKVGELAGSYGGALGAYLAFGAGEFMTDDEITTTVKSWRKDSPEIPRLWYGLQDAAHAAVANPGSTHSYRGIEYVVDNDILFCKKPSGERISYHSPRLGMVQKPWGEVVELSYMGWNTDRTKGAYGWVRLSTWGGKLAENVIQSIARDIMASSMLRVARAGYEIVLHVHDEIIAQQPIGTGDLSQFETLMSQMPTWCAAWPIRAQGGWIGHRFRKV